jgi:hypothetical protein
MKPETSNLKPGSLPPWKVDELPAPLPFSLRNALRTIGPGAILLVGAIGMGEWIAGPCLWCSMGAACCGSRRWRLCCNRS